MSESGEPGGVLNYWRSVDAEPAVDLAREEELLATAAGGKVCAAFWSWTTPVVVLGYGQPVDDADLDLCRTRELPVRRRITGGTGVIHREDLAVSLALPVGHPWAETIRGLYQSFLAVIRESLAACGVETASPPAGPARSRRERSPICFEDVLAETLTVNGRKVVGCAQARRRDSVLVHAHVHLNPDLGLYSKVFGVPFDRVERALAGVGREAGPMDLAIELADALSAALSLRLEQISPPDPDPAFLERYHSPRWAPPSH